MGKAQSKLSADELAELQKNTYCESYLPGPLIPSTRQSFRAALRELRPHDFERRS